MLQDLPLLVLNLVCDHLSYEDVLALRSTCKSLKIWVDGKKFTKLNLFYRKLWNDRNLFYTGDPIGYSNSYHWENLAILGSPRFREQFQNVRRMCIFSSSQIIHPDIDENAFDLSCLNYFSSLNHLEVNQLYGFEGKLSLPDLQIASFNNSKTLESLRLNCPKLKALKISKINGYRLVLSPGTDQLNYLYQADNSLQHPIQPLDYTKFKNLTTIAFKKIEHVLKFVSKLLTDSLTLPSLSLIRLERFDCWTKLKELVKCLNDLKREPRTEHIQFICNNKAIDSPDELLLIAKSIEGSPDLKFPKDRLFSLLSTNPDLDFLFCAVRLVNLEKNMELNEEMIKKLENTKKLRLVYPHSASQTLELFARTCNGKSLYFLALNKQTVTERLLEMLSEHLLSLEQINLSKCKCETLKPLIKFRHLQLVDLDFSPSRAELTTIYENSRTLKSIRIDLGDLGDKYGPIKLLRTTTLPRTHKIAQTCYSVLRFDSLNAMIEYYYHKTL